MDYQLYICGLQVGYRVRGFQSGYKSFRSYMRIRVLGGWFGGFLHRFVVFCFSLTYWMVVRLGVFWGFLGGL